ncbi:MAG TPA: hypothetical protein VMU08_14045 [Rhizomicrobium sp.]|nr:hypothetical protein [Rhizomicrobium sp.]
MHEDIALEANRKNAPKYERPTVVVMSDEEVLRAFQMTAAQIGAAATWWTASCAAC